MALPRRKQHQGRGQPLASNARRRSIPRPRPAPHSLDPADRPRIVAGCSRCSERRACLRSRQSRGPQSSPTTRRRHAPSPPFSTGATFPRSWAGFRLLAATAAQGQAPLRARRLPPGFSRPFDEHLLVEDRAVRTGSERCACRVHRHSLTVELSTPAAARRRLPSHPRGSASAPSLAVSTTLGGSCRRPLACGSALVTTPGHWAAAQMRNCSPASTSLCVSRNRCPLEAASRQAALSSANAAVATSALGRKRPRNQRTFTKTPLGQRHSGLYWRSPAESIT